MVDIIAPKQKNSMRYSGGESRLFFLIFKSKDQSYIAKIIYVAKVNFGSGFYQPPSVKERFKIFLKEIQALHRRQSKCK